MMPMETMQFEAMLMQVTQPRGWATTKDMQGNLTIVVPVKPGRNQTVYVTYGKDSEQGTMAFFWSICAEASVVRDPMAVLRANYGLSYGAYTIRETNLIIQDGLFIGGADPNTIAKIIWHVAKNADAYEEAIYGYMQRF
jgi:hypothetical protein